MNRAGKKIAVALALLALAGLPLHGDTPATRPATQPTATHTVKKGKLNLEVQAEVTLQPLDPYELKLKLKQYAGPLAIVSIAAPNSPVKAGDPLLELDRRQLNWELEMARNALAGAKAALAKAEADQELGAKADALALRIQEDALKNAEQAVAWYDKVDGPQMLKSVELSILNAKHAVEDQDDELDQLRKMYKTEELTNATADIVIKRAVRSFEQSKIRLKMAEERGEKSTTFDVPITRQKVVDALEQTKQQSAGLKVAQELSAVQRKNALAAAKIASEQAEHKLKELTEDAALFSVKAPADGVVMYGNLTEGAWQGGDPKALRPGEKLTAGSTVLRVVTPGKLKLDVPLTEPQAFWVAAGMKARVTPAALPYLSYDATCAAPVAQPRGGQGAFGFQTTVALPSVDARLLPGMKASVRIEAPEAAEVLLVPVAHVLNGQVSVSGERRAVELGRSDGAHVEVRSGLKEGDQITPPSAGK